MIQVTSEDFICPQREQQSPSSNED